MRTTVIDATLASSACTTRATLLLMTAALRAPRTATMTAPILTTEAGKRHHLARAATVPTGLATNGGTMVILISGLVPVAGRRVAEAAEAAERDETGVGMGLI